MRILNKYFWRELYYTISAFINPRQKWLIKKIPRHWIDKDGLIEMVLFESLKHFVEEEKCLEVLHNSEPPEQKKFIDEVRINYKLITEKFPELECQIDMEFEKFPKLNFKNCIKELNAGNTLNRYDKINKIEKELGELKNQVALWIVTNRGGMWT